MGVDQTDKQLPEPNDQSNSISSPPIVPDETHFQTLSGPLNPREWSALVGKLGHPQEHGSGTAHPAEMSTKQRSLSSDRSSLPPTPTSSITEDRDTAVEQAQALINERQAKTRVLEEATSIAEGSDAAASADALVHELPTLSHQTHIRERLKDRIAKRLAKTFPPIPNNASKFDR